MAAEIWILAEIEKGKVSKITWELLTAGASLAGTTGRPVAALLLGSGLTEAVAGLRAYADKIYLLEDERLSGYDSDTYLSCLSALVEQGAPAVLLGGATSQGRDLFPRLAMRLGGGYAPDCVGLVLDQEGSLTATRPVQGGKIMAEVGFSRNRPQLATLRNNIFPAGDAPNKAAEIIKVTPEIAPVPWDKKVLGREMTETPRPDVSEAEVVVAAGRGIRSPENFQLIEELADQLGAAVGASRAVVDEGWRNHQDQIGKSGKNISARLYVACGISGAVHHVLGIGGCKTVVAVDANPQALIFNYADYGLVGDLLQIVPALTAELKKTGV